MADGQIDIDVVLNESGAKKQAQQLGNELGKQISSSVDSAASSASKSTSKAVSEIGSTLNSFGSSYTKAITLPIAAAATATGAAAVKIDTALTGVRKTVDGTEQEYEALKDAAIEFSQTNAVDPAQILDIQALGAQLGYTIDELDMFGEVVSGLDIATNMDADTAATELAQFANIMGMAHDETKNYGSTIVELGNNFATTEADISHMAMRIAGAGKQIGLSEADVLGLATALSSMGIEAEAGGTAISTIMSQIDKDVALNTDNLSLWAETAGMSVDAFAAAWGEDAVGALSAVLVGMDSATQAGGNMSVMLDELGITSIRQTDTLKRLASNSEFLGNAVLTANDAWKENVALDKEVENRNASMAAQLQILWNKVQAVAIELGEAMTGSLIDIIDLAEPFIQALASGAKAFGDLDDGAKKAVLAAIGIVAAFGPLTSVTGKLITTVTSGTKSWQMFKKNVDLVRSALATSTTSMNGFTRYAESANGSIVKWNSSTQSYVQTNSKLAKALATSKAGMIAQTVAAKTSATAMNLASKAASLFNSALKAIAPVAVLSAIVTVISHISESLSEASEHAKEMEKRTTGVTSAMDAFETSMQEAANSTTDYSGSLDSVIEKNKAVLDAQSELADSLTETWQEAGTNVALLQQYGDSIDRLAGKSGLTASEQAELQAAIKGVNDIMGTSYSIIDSENGILSENKDVILAVRDAWIQKAEAQAAQEAYAEALKQQESITAQLAAAEEKLANTEKGLYVQFGNLEVASDEQGRAYHELETQVNDLRASKEATSGTVEQLKGRLEGLNETIQSGVEPLTDYISATYEWQSALSNAGVNGQEFVQALSDIGVSTQDLSAIMANEGVEGINGFISAYQSGTSELIAWLYEHGIEIPASLAEGIEAGKPQSDAAASDAANSVQDNLDSVDGYGSGYEAVSGMAQGEDDAKSRVEITSKTVALTARSGMQSQNGNAGTWGEHLVQNFAGGMLGRGLQAVMGAANRVMASISSIMGFSVPDKGPFSGAEKGGERSGLHLLQNFARGMRSGTDEALEAAQYATDGIYSEFVELGGDIGAAIMEGYKDADPMAQVEMSMKQGASAINIMAANQAAGSTYNTNNQTVNFTNPVSSPDEMARMLRMQQKYGLAG